jgi:hypothetical protein
MSHVDSRTSVLSLFSFVLLKLRFVRFTIEMSDKARSFLLFRSPKTRAYPHRSFDRMLPYRSLGMPSRFSAAGTLPRHLIRYISSFSKAVCDEFCLEFGNHSSAALTGLYHS